jgi:hypothetical protein
MAARPFLEGQGCDVAVLVNGVVVKEVFVGFRVIFSNERTSRLTPGQTALDGRLAPEGFRGGWCWRSATFGRGAAILQQG